MEAGKIFIALGPKEKSIFVHFENLKDPRIERDIKHNLMDIITIAICAVIANANDWQKIETWALCKKE